MFENIPFKRPLVIGTGGGNDIVSATLILADLQDRHIYGDLAGICSPGALHVYNGMAERSVNTVFGNTQRFIESKNRKSVTFIDSLVPQVLKNNNLLGRVYNLSGRFGTDALIEELEILASQREYDGIIAVDVGGDILSRGKKDPTVLSPLMDFTTLYAVSKLSTSSVLVEFGLQTDGELRPQGCAEILDELRLNRMLLAETKIKKEDPAVRKLEEVYGGIKDVRHGHTAAMTFRTLEETEDINTEYRFHVQVLDKKVTHRFPIKLESKYFGKAFVIDLKSLAKNRANAFSYNNNLEMYLRTKLIADTKTEMDNLYYSDGENVTWLGMVCPQIAGDERKDLINHGLDNLPLHADSAILWTKDTENLRLRKHSTSVGDFTLTAESKEKLSGLNKSVEGVLN
jgi:DNA-directed RNA polymerase subunit H (RpoH/RPB5)